MTKVVGVRFRQVGKIYFFAPGKYSVETGQHVIVETARGVEYGQVVLGEREVETKVETKVEKVETQVKTNEQVAKKRRGRPRKIVQNVDETPVQKKENIEVKPVVKAKEESISKVEKVEKVETVEQANPVAALVKAINRLTREVNSLKRLVAGKKRINY